MGAELLRTVIGQGPDGVSLRPNRLNRVASNGTRVSIDIARAIQLGGAVPYPRGLIIIPELSVQDESRSRDLPPGSHQMNRGSILAWTWTDSTNPQLRITTRSPSASSSTGL